MDQQDYSQYNNYRGNVVFLQEAEEEEDKEEKRGEKWEKLRCCSYDSLGQCWPDNSATQGMSKYWINFNLLLFDL